MTIVLKPDELKWMIDNAKRVRKAVEAIEITDPQFRAPPYDMWYEERFRAVKEYRGDYIPKGAVLISFLKKRIECKASKIDDRLYYKCTYTPVERKYCLMIYRGEKGIKAKEIACSLIDRALSAGALEKYYEGAESPHENVVKKKFEERKKRPPAFWV